FKSKKGSTGVHCWQNHPAVAVNQEVDPYAVNSGFSPCALSGRPGRGLRAGPGPGTGSGGTRALLSGATRAGSDRATAWRLPVGAGGAGQNLADGPVPAKFAGTRPAAALSSLHAQPAPGVVSPDRHARAAGGVCRTARRPLSGAVL